MSNYKLILLSIFCLQSIFVAAANPTVTINQAGGQIDPTNTSPIVFTVVFSEGVTGFDSNSDLDFSGSTTGGTLSAVITPTNATTYTVSVSGMTGPGIVQIAVVAGAATATAAPNDPNLTSTSSDNTVQYGINPTVTIEQGALQSDPATSLPIVFTATFSEPVSGFGSDDLTFGGTAGGTLSAIISQTGPMDGSTYSVSVSGATTSGTVIVDIDAAAAQAVASPNTTSIASTSTDNTITYHASPSATVSVASGQPSPTTETAINFTAVFSESVGGFADDTNITFGGTATGTLSATVTEIAPNDGTTYDIEVSGMTSIGTVTLTLDAGAGTASLGGQLSIASNTASVTFQSPAPTVTINQKVGQLDPTNDFPIEFTVVFSDPVTGFDNVTTDVSSAGSSATGLTGSITPISSTTYTVSVTGADASQDADIILTIPAGAANRIDGLGTANVASTSTDNTVRYDDVDPAVSTLSPGDNAVDVAVTLSSITITFDENIRIDVGTIADDTDRIRIRDNSSNILVIDKDSPLITINNNVATIDISGATFNSNTGYNIRIGNDVFEDLAGTDGNNYAGISSNSDWNFTTVGLGVNGPDITLCIGADYIEIGDITISEAAKSDFSSGSNQTFTLTIPSGFEFQPGVGSVAVSGADISNATLAVSATKIFISYDIDGTSNNPVDEIIISNLRAKALSGPTSGDILRTGGDAVQSGNSVADTNSHGLLSSANGDLVFSNDATSNTICIGEAVEFTATATGATNYELFIDGVSAGTNGTGIFSGITSITNGQEISVVATGGNCTETAAVIFTVNDLPVVDAGAPQTLCAGEELVLGGSPTLIDATGATPYTYNWTGTGMTAPEQVKANPQITAPNPGASDQVYNYAVTVTDANGCTSVVDDVAVTVKSISEAVAITKPPQFNFADTDAPVILEATPAGGSFSGTGVIELGDGTYQFNPASAGTTNSPHLVSYTTTLSNGCQKTISQNFNVTEGSNIIVGLPVNNNFCSNEGQTARLALSNGPPTDYEQILFNAQYSLVEFSLNPPNGGLSGTPGTARLRNPLLYNSDPNFTGNITQAHIEPNQRFNPSQVTPGNYNISAIIHYDYEPEGSNFAWVGQSFRVNEVPNVFFTGLSSGLSDPSSFCRVNQDYVLTGNQPGGVWEIGFNNANFQAANSTGVNGLSSSSGTQAVFNPSEVSQEGNWTIRYRFDPGTFGSTNQPCEGITTQTINVFNLPTVSFNEPSSEVEEGEEYCYDSPAELIVGSQTTGDIMYSGYGVSFNSGTGQALFSPSAAINQFEFDNNTTVTSPQNFQITFTYRNANECVNSVVRNVTVYPLPAASFSFGQNNLCYNSSTVLLDANQPQGKFFLTYPNGSTEEVATNQDFVFDPSIQFDEAVSRGHNPLDAASFNVEWRVRTDIDGGNKTCFNSQFETFTVTPLETVTMAGISDGDTYCSNEDDIEIELSPSGGNLTVNSVAIGLGGGTLFNFSPSGSGPGNYTITYSVTTGNGCTSTITKMIDVLPSPEANFPITTYCSGDIINFDADNDANAAEYEWNFGDNSPLEYGQNVTHQYATIGSFTATLTLRSAPVNGVICSSTIQKIVDIGSFPNADFTFTNVCEGETTIFNPTANISINTYTWDFGDGTPSVVSANPGHEYTAVGNYDVTLTAATANGCEDIITRRVSILPNSTNDPNSPYLMSDIAGGAGGWAERDGNENLNSIWEFGIPSGTIINSSEPAWVTNLSGNYGSNENAYVLSPCFDLSGFQRPVLTMDYWSDTQRESDGAVFQYSIDGGSSWQTLGSIQNGISTGLNWYNQSGITGNPGGQQLVGWSRAGDTDWSTARHALDEIPLPRDNVRFRVAFGSNGDTELEGFAFKNVKIEERNKVVLLEHFTNSETQTQAETYVRNFGSSSNEVIKLEYRTNFPGQDNLNLQNPADNNSRVAYYGITSSPQSYLDGDGEESLISSGWGNILFSRKTLRTSPFELSLNSSVNGDTLLVNVGITTTSSVEDDNTVVHLVLAQKSASSNQFIYQMHKMYPNAAGTKLKGGAIVEIGESYNLSYQIRISDPLDPNLTAAIAFIQNEDTREVYQASFIELTDLPPLVTGIDGNIDKTSFNLFPNPVNGSVTITFNGQIGEKNYLNIYDTFGKLVYHKSLMEGDREIKVDTRDFAGGLYHVQMKDKDGLPLRKRLMVVHQQ